MNTETRLLPGAAVALFEVLRFYCFFCELRLASSQNPGRKEKVYRTIMLAIEQQHWILERLSVVILSENIRQ
jgi:hypothetical protein